MTYPGSRSHTWVPGERVDDTVLNEWGPKNVAWGLVAAAEGTGSQSGITTVADITSATITAAIKAGRKYRLEGFLTAKWGTPGPSGNYFDVLIRDSSNVQIAAAQGPGNYNGYLTVPVKTLLTPGADATKTYKLSLQRNVTSGAGSLDLAGAWELSLWDVGPATP